MMGVYLDKYSDFIKLCINLDLLTKLGHMVCPNYH